MDFSETDRQELDRALWADARRFGPKLAAVAADRGLAVTSKEHGLTTPIPITATPVIIARAELKRRQRLAAHLASAGVKMSKAVLGGELRSVVVDGLSLLEQSLALSGYDRVGTLATTRVDFFNSPQGPMALELNATIPAMQAYSDIAANTFLEVVGEHWGAPHHMIDRWKAQNGSNALALFRALVDGYARLRGGKRPERLGILTRRRDAQLTELNYLASRFTDFGCETDIIYPDELSGAERVMARGRPYPFIYRHLFVRRLEEPDLAGADYVKALLAEPNGRRAVVLNPPASQVESKAVFALLSQATEDAALAASAGLSNDELAAISQTVPMTRIFRGPKLLAEVEAHPDQWVLKRSWDYGGRAVFVGRSRETDGFRERTKAAYGEALDWKATCAKAAVDTAGGGFVAQRLVETSTDTHLVCAGAQVTETPLFVDFSAYASVGLERQPDWGGVCRGSVQHIVNIVGGGGVLPLLSEEAAEGLLAMYRLGRRAR